MTAQELIIELQKMPSNTKVVIRGYENGYNDILNLKPVKIKLNTNTNWYDGEYDFSSDNDAQEAIDLFGQNTHATQ
jgi:hypothetical protein